MSDTALILYLINILGALDHFFIALFVISTTFLAAYFFAPSEEIYLKYIIYAQCVTTFLFIISLFIPAKEDMYLIFGVHVGETLITSDKSNVILDKSYRVLEKKLDNMLGEEKQKIIEKSINMSDI